VVTGPDAPICDLGVFRAISLVDDSVKCEGVFLFRAYPWGVEKKITEKKLTNQVSFD
jgi:hypothetical protein